MFGLDQIVFSRVTLASVKDESFKIKKGTVGIVFDISFGGGIDEVFYIVDFELSNKHIVQAIARDFEISQNGPLPH